MAPSPPVHSPINILFHHLYNINSLKIDLLLVYLMPVYGFVSVPAPVWPSINIRRPNIEPHSPNVLSGQRGPSASVAWSSPRSLGLLALRLVRDRCWSMDCLNYFLPFRLCVRAAVCTLQWLALTYRRESKLMNHCNEINQNGGNR